MTKNICPSCEKITEQEFVCGQTIITVRGEPIEVEDQYLRCSECGEEFDDPQSPFDVLDLAYREYRKRHGMLQPEEIRNWRKKYNLTQKELNDLLAWGAVTLSRYEQGKLQDEAHERVLRLAMDPHNLLNLIHNNPNAMPQEKREILINELTTELQQANSFELFYEKRFGNYPPNIFSGYQKLNIEKLLACICFFCYKADNFITKINKLLFYADFKHFKNNASSITGARYARINYGPVPDKYDFYFALIKINKSMVCEEVSINNFSGEKILYNGKLELSCFDEAEIETLIEVKNYFKNFNAKKISDFSHEELGYMETEQGGFISYEFAKDLKI